MTPNRADAAARSSALERTPPDLRWLDDQLRKERAQVNELRDTVDKQQVALVDQSQRIMQLEDMLTKLRAQLLRVDEVEEAIQHTRDEVGILLAEQREAFQKNQTEFLRNRQAERESDVRTLAEIRLELERLVPLEQGLAVRQAEEQRLNEALLRVEQQLGVLVGRVRDADGQRRGLGDGISKNVVEIKKLVEVSQILRQDANAAVERLLAVEDRLPRLAGQLSELSTMRAEITEQQEEMLENQRRAERARVQQMTEWGRRLEGYAHQLETWADQLRYFADQHEKNRRVLRDTQTLAQELAQKQDQLRQLQRLAEEQLRREAREFQRDIEQRFAQERQRREQQTASQSEREDTQEVLLTSLQESDDRLDERLQAVDERVDELTVSTQSELAGLRARLQDVWADVAETFGQTLARLRGGGGGEEG